MRFVCVAQRSHVKQCPNFPQVSPQGNTQQAALPIMYWVGRRSVTVTHSDTRVRGTSRQTDTHELSHCDEHLFILYQIIFLKDTTFCTTSYRTITTKSRTAVLRHRGRGVKNKNSSRRQFSRGRTALGRWRVGGSGWTPLFGAAHRGHDALTKYW